MHCTTAFESSATSPPYCSSAPELVDPLKLKFLSLGVHCKVQLMSKELELDAYGMQVPKDWKLIELLVLDDSRQAIELLVASTPDYVGYTVVDRGQVIDDTEPF